MSQASRIFSQNSQIIDAEKVLPLIMMEDQNKFPLLKFKNLSGLNKPLSTKKQFGFKNKIIFLIFYTLPNTKRISKAKLMKIFNLKAKFCRNLYRYYDDYKRFAFSNTQRDIFQKKKNENLEMLSQAEERMTLCRKSKYLHEDLKIIFKILSGKNFKLQQWFEISQSKIKNAQIREEISQKEKLSLAQTVDRVELKKSIIQKINDQVKKQIPSMNYKLVFQEEEDMADNKNHVQSKQNANNGQIMVQEEVFTPVNTNPVCLESNVQMYYNYHYQASLQNQYPSFCYPTSYNSPYGLYQNQTPWFFTGIMPTDFVGASYMPDKLNCQLNTRRSSQEELPYVASKVKITKTIQIKP